MRGVFWQVDQHQALTPGVRAYLSTNYGYTAPPTDTWVALVSILHHRDDSIVCLSTFPFSFVLATYQSGATGVLEDAIDAACRSRLLQIRNAEPLISILNRVHPL